MSKNGEITTNPLDYADRDTKGEERQSTTDILKRLEDDRYFQLFIKSLQTEATEKTYRYSLATYLQFHGFTSTGEMMNKSEKEIESDIVQYASERTVSKATMSARLMAIKKFYRANRIKLDWEYILDFNKGEHIIHEDKPYTKEQIAKILEFCDVRTRPLVLLMASGAMRVGAIPDLRVKDLKKIESYHLYQVTVYRGTKDKYITFCTPEASLAIDKYFEYRKQAGEELTPESPVIRDTVDKDNLLRVKSPKALSARSLKQVLYITIQRAGVRQVQHVQGRDRRERHETQTTHGFRKFAETTMIRNGVNAVDAESLLGHKTGLIHRYNRPSEEELLKEYLKAVDALTIDGKNALEKQVIKLQGEKDKLILTLEKRLRYIEKRLLQESDEFAAHLNEQSEPSYIARAMGISEESVHEAMYDLEMEFSNGGQEEN